jgi:ABC-type multidrug transport system ATPase subunit
VIQDSPPDRGPLGGELRRLSIAVEIITLPSIIVLDDPTRGLEPAVAAHLFGRIRLLADKGCTVITSIPTPLPSMLDHIDRVVIVADGYSLFSSKKENIIPYFTSPAVGFNPPAEGHLIDFIFQIAQGQSSLSSKGAEFDASQLHNSFSSSPFFEGSEGVKDAIELLPDTHEKYYGYFKSDPWPVVLSRIIVVCERAFVTKFKETDVIKKGWVSNIIIALLIGYFGYNTGDFGDFAKSLFLPYNEALNCASLLFIVTAFLIVQQVSNVHTICQKLRVFRYEQKANCCPMAGMWIATLASEYFSGMFFSLVFSTILFFLTSLNELDQMSFFIRVVLEMTFVGVTVATALAGIFRTEIVVRDVFLLYLFANIMLSGFPFQLTSMTQEASDLSAINPLRWCYEALMTWKFEDYVDGEAFLTPYGFENFDKNKVFRILFNFIIFNTFIFMMTLTPPPNSLERKPKELRINYSKKPSPKRLQKSGKVNSSNSSLLTKKVGVSSSDAVSSPESINKTAESDNTASKPFVEGPKVYFEEISYIVKDRNSPLGHKNVIVEASGQFEPGKISVIMGSGDSGKSVLLHLLAGNAPAFNARQFGRILVNGKPYNKSDKPWQRAAYVDAIDYQYRDITVLEVLKYAALLRCREPKDLLVAEDNLNETLDIMQLREVQGKLTKDISKGATRRLSIAEEIIHGIPLVIVDEPACVADPDSSIVMDCLRGLANRKSTVIISAYQPPLSDFQQFDILLLLSKGRVIFNGPASEAFDFFKNRSNLLFDLSKYYNPADFFADLSVGTVAMQNDTVVDSIILEKLYKKTSYFKSFLDIKSKYDEDSSGSANPLVRMHVDSGEDVNRKTEIDRNSAFDYGTKSINSGFSFSSFRPQFYFVGLISVIYQNALQLASIKPSMLFSRIRILLVRSTLVLCKRYKLLLGALFLHILLALIFAFIAGDVSEEISPVLSFYGVGALLLIILNIQFAFFIYKGNEVKKTYEIAPDAPL